MAKNQYLKGKMMEPSPTVQFEKWFQEILLTGTPYPEACCVSTLSPEGYPEGRMVLMKSFDERGFVFFSNRASVKGHSLEGCPRASLTFYWQPLHRQVRILGEVELAATEEADAYFSSRPRTSQLGAWASLQSRPLKNRGVFEDRLKKITLKFKGKKVPRPPEWVGYRIIPRKIEFWQERPHRLHDRFCYIQTPKGWKIQRLYP